MNFWKQRQTTSKPAPIGKNAGMVLLDTGWRRVLGYDGRVTCPLEKRVEFYRPEWNELVVTRYTEFHPEMNVFGLFWRSIEEENV